MATKKISPAKPAPKPKEKAQAKTPTRDQSEHGFVRDLALILRETELTEIEVERNGLRIRVARQFGYGPVTHVAAAHAPTPTVAPPIQTHATASAATTAAERAQNPGAVKSPMVGTAYHAPSPGAAAFVKLGDEVKEGQTLLIIEAMKTMNQIPAPRAGKIVDILFKDGQPVEYGEVLMILE